MKIQSNSLLFWLSYHKLMQKIHEKSLFLRNVDHTLLLWPIPMSIYFAYRFLCYLKLKRNLKCISRRSFISNAKQNPLIHSQTTKFIIDRLYLTLASKILFFHFMMHPLIYFIATHTHTEIMSKSPTYKYETSQNITWIFSSVSFIRQNNWINVSHICQPNICTRTVQNFGH